MFDYLCIDWGQVRCGLAFGNSQTGLILPFAKNLPFDDIFIVLKKELTERKIKNIVVGRPTNFHFKDTEVTLKIENFIKELVKTHPETIIHTENERNSSKSVKSSGTRVDKFNINHLAAMQILENFFARNSI